VTILLRPIADNRRATLIVSLQIDAEKQAAIRSEIAGVQRAFRGEVVVKQGLSLVERLKRLVRHRGIAAHKSNLIERVSGLHLDRERSGDNFEIEGSGIAGSDFIESCVEIGYDAGKDVQPSGRTFGIRSRPHGLR